MSEVKKSVWNIRTTEVMLHKVVFSEELTEKEAVDLFWDSDYEEIMNSETIDTEEAWIEEGDNK